MPSRQTGMILSVIALALIIGWSLHRWRGRAADVTLVFNPSDFNRMLLERMRILQAPYAATPWLFNAHLQLLWLLICDALAPRLNYERTETLRMRDGGTTALDWVGLGGSPTTPTLVVLPSITGDAHSVRQTVRDFRSATGWRVVVCTRRGHGNLPLTAPLFNTLGCTRDLGEQLQRIQSQVPASPLYAVGISAGSALLVRYLGETGAQSPLRAAVAYCPGYDLRVAWDRVPRSYSRAMAKRLKRYFLQRHAAVLQSLEAYRSCLATADLASFQRQVHALAGCASAADYLQQCNPVEVMDRVAVPVLVINADDDPVCVVQNTLDHVEAIRGLADAVLVRTPLGSHCAFFEGWRARSWSHRLIAEYLRVASEIQGHGGWRQTGCDSADSAATPVETPPCDAIAARSPCVHAAGDAGASSRDLAAAIAAARTPNATG